MNCLWLALYIVGKSNRAGFAGGGDDRRDRCLTVRMYSTSRGSSVLSPHFCDTRSGGNPGQAGGSRGEGEAEGKRPGEVSVSTVLTLTPYWRRSPRRSRGIPTISVGYFGGWRANVSAVDTWLLPDPPARPQSSRWETSLASAPIRRGGTWWWCHPAGHLSQRIRPPRDV